MGPVSLEYSFGYILYEIIKRMITKTTMGDNECGCRLKTKKGPGRTDRDKDIMVNDKKAKSQQTVDNRGDQNVEHMNGNNGIKYWVKS